MESVSGHPQGNRHLYVVWSKNSIYSLAFVVIYRLVP